MSRTIKMLVQGTIPFLLAFPIWLAQSNDVCADVVLNEVNERAEKTISLPRFEFAVTESTGSSELDQLATLLNVAPGSEAFASSTAQDNLNPQTGEEIRTVAEPNMLPGVIGLSAFLIFMTRRNRKHSNTGRLAV